MKHLTLSLILISMSAIRLYAQENDFTGLSSIYPVVNLETEKWGGGFEVAGINKIGIGAQVEYFPDDSLSLTSTRGFLLWPITETFLIKTALGANIENPKEKRYPDNYLTTGLGFVYLKSQVYLGFQCNIDFERKIAPTVAFMVGLKFN